MNSARERKTKPLPKKALHASAGLRQRRQGDDDSMADGGWSSALDPELYGGKERARKGREKKIKRSGRNQTEERPFEGLDPGAAASGGSLDPSLQPFRSCPRVADATVNSLFVSWEELLGSREQVKCRIDTIAAVHGWDGVHAQNGFLSGVEPSALMQSIQAEVSALEPAAEALERAGLLLELQAAREQLEAAVEERERLADDLHQSQEDCFQARDQLAGQSAELEVLREQALSAARAKAAEAGVDSQNGAGGEAAARADAAARAGGSGSDPLAAFKVTLSRGQVAEGRRIVEALERLKVPDETAMGPRELACWHENKKTIMNSLKTLSGQIYSATTRILYEIIQNADDCSFEHDDDVAGQEPRAMRELYLECSDEALVAFHNEKGFQPKDLYAMCQVGESSKAAGSGKIGRKGIGFKSVFQICDQPVVLSPPFQFCFDTLKHEVFGYIVPSWVDAPLEHVPAKHRQHLGRVWGESGGPSATGTLLVCPMASRVRGLDLMRDLNFDGLSLAFLKNLEKISFVSSVSRASSREHGAGLSVASSAADSSSREHVYRVERTEEELGGLQNVAEGVLKGINVVCHKLFSCAIIQREDGVETRRHYRLHSYTLHKYKSDATPGGVAATPATTVISLAFPVDDALAPLRSAEGELIFAYLPVCAAGFGFAINADFELVASRQDVSDSNSGNHVLLGRIPPLFVHAVLTDPALGEEAFPTYLPDVEGIRKDRSGGGRKWHTLASALHRQTGAWMMIVTEYGERVKRKQVVLRPKHLSQALVPNSLLKEVSSTLECGELHFAHPDAVVDMALENCIDYCPVGIILLCIRRLLEPTDEWPLAVWDEGAAYTGKRPSKKQKKRAGKASHWDEEFNGDGAGSAGQISTGEPPLPAISESLLLDVWHYLAAECNACVKQGAAGQPALRLIVDTVIAGGMDSSIHTCDHLNVQTGLPKRPLRIFPVRGSSRLRLHSEHGVPLCNGLSPSLAAQGSFVLRLAQRVVPRLDLVRLQNVEGIMETMRLLRIGEATEEELETQLRNCFRFGIATTADPQLWWDSFRYAVRRGHRHGLVDFMPGTAIALPLTDRQGGVVSSRDVQRLSVGMPCLLGIRRKPATNNKYLLAIPPSASTWSARVRWELAVVQAFGVTYPKSDVERIQMKAFSSDLLYAVAECREAGDRRTLEALTELLDLYQSRLGSLLPLLRSAAQVSLRSEVCLLEKRTSPEFRPFASSCSPKWVEEALNFGNIVLSDDSYHNVRDLLERSLGMLRLRLVGAGKTKDGAAPAEGENAHGLSCAAEAGDRGAAMDGKALEKAALAALGLDDSDDSNSEYASAEEESVSDQDAGVVKAENDDDEDEDDEDDEDDDEEAVDEITWEVLERLLGFYHMFEPRDCLLLYSVFTPALLEEQPGFFGDSGQMRRTLSPLALSMKPFLAKLELGIVLGCCADELDVAADLWPQICNTGGIWLKGDFVDLERCVWRSGCVEIWQALSEWGCPAGRVVAIEPMLAHYTGDAASEWTLDREEKGWLDFLQNFHRCCIKGSEQQHGSGRGSRTFPALPRPTDLEMMLHGTLPMLLDRELVELGNLSRERGLEHQWSRPVMLCYQAIIASLQEFFPPGRWQIPVPTAHLETGHVVIDAALNPQLARDATALLVLPDAGSCPAATALVLRHFGEHCLHPTLVPLFVPVANRQSVGLETPCARVQRTFKRSLRLAVGDAITPLPAPSAAAAAGVASGVDDSNDGLDVVWALVSEVYERPMVSEASAQDGETVIPSGLSDADHWELLMWAAITCAKQWIRMQATGNPCHGSRYQETLQRVRWLVPFIKDSSRMESWGFLAERPQAATNAHAISRGVLLLRTLFGVQLWGNLNGLELLEQAPAYTTNIPTHILSTGFQFRGSGDTDTPEESWEPDSLEMSSAASFAEDFERAHLVLIWEWFLLEVAGAAPPAVLWTTIQEPIRAWARPQIRQIEAQLRAELPDESYLQLLQCVCDHTQVGRLMDEMDAIDEARAEAAAREAEQRRQEREAAQARRRAEAEVVRRQREAERQERQRQEAEQRLEAERERRVLRASQDARDEPSHAPGLAGAGLRWLRQQAAPQGDPTPAPAPPPAPVSPAQAAASPARSRAEMREMIQALQDEIEMLRRPLEQNVGGLEPGAEAGARPMPYLGGIAGAFQAFLGPAAADGRAAPPVRRHVGGQTMRESEVKGKLARFLAGMRAYQRQQGAATHLQGDGSHGAQQPLPPVLSEFIAWAGGVLEGEQQHGDGSAANTEEVARRYVAGGGVSGVSGGGAAVQAGDDDEDEKCCICLEILSDASLYVQLGEPVQTVCGHRFHAVCYASTMERTQDPFCPMCRSVNFGRLRL